MIFIWLLMLGTLTSCQSCSSEYKNVNEIIVEELEIPVPLGDPFILLHNGTYYAYGTHSDEGIEVYISDNLKTWKYKGLALNKKDSWADRWFWAPEVYEVPHVYFVWKPDLEVRLPQALQAACRESRRSVLPLNWKGHKKFIFMDEIMYIERELRKSRIVLPECEHYVYMTLEELMERLQEQRFIRIHKSYIVNMRYIDRIDRKNVLLQGGRAVPISRSKQEETRTRCLLYRGARR